MARLTLTSPIRREVEAIKAKCATFSAADEIIDAWETLQLTLNQNPPTSDIASYFTTQELSCIENARQASRNQTNEKVQSLRNSAWALTPASLTTHFGERILHSRRFLAVLIKFSKEELSFSEALPFFDSARENRISSRSHCRLRNDQWYLPDAEAAIALFRASRDDSSTMPAAGSRGRKRKRGARTRMDEGIREAGDEPLRSRQSTAEPLGGRDASDVRRGAGQARFGNTPGTDTGPQARQRLPDRQDEQDENAEEVAGLRRPENLHGQGASVQTCRSIHKDPSTPARRRRVTGAGPGTRRSQSSESSCSSIERGRGGVDDYRRDYSDDNNFVLPSESPPSGGRRSPIDHDTCGDTRSPPADHDNTIPKPLPSNTISTTDKISTSGSNESSARQDTTASSTSQLQNIPLGPFSVTNTPSMLLQNLHQEAIDRVNMQLTEWGAFLQTPGNDLASIQFKKSVTETQQAEQQTREKKLRAGISEYEARLQSLSQWTALDNLDRSSDGDEDGGDAAEIQQLQERQKKRIRTLAAEVQQARQMCEQFNEELQRLDRKQAEVVELQQTCERGSVYIDKLRGLLV